MSSTIGVNRMTIQYGLTLENQKLIDKKAETKNDGVYSFRGVVYRVVKNAAKFYACNGQVLQNESGFNVLIGSYGISYGQDEAAKVLKNLVE